MTTNSREEIVRLDKRYVWHPYTEMQTYISEISPLVITRAEGSRLIDHSGRSYIDGNASWWTALLGHHHPRLVARLKQQADALCHVPLAGITHEPAALLAEELCEVAPEGLEHVFFSDNGSTAVELAVKMCAQYWGQNGHPKRTRFLVLSDAFHGETLGATALGGVEAFRKPFGPLLMDCLRAPGTQEGAERTFASLERMLRSGVDEIAGVVVEPLVQGAGGMQMYSAGLLRKLREWTTELDIFLVADEVFTGYGRTGAMWACDHAQVCPDIMCVAKGFTGGMLPMAATLATRRIFEGFQGAAERALYYGHTYCGHPLGAAVAREVLSIYQDEQVIANCRPKAARIAATFAALGELPGVEQPRTLGMIGALQLGSTAGYLEQAGWRVYEEALKRGAYLRPLGNVVYVAPPLNIADEDLNELLECLTAAVTTVVDT